MRGEHKQSMIESEVFFFFPMKESVAKGERVRERERGGEALDSLA